MSNFALTDAMSQNARRRVLYSVVCATCHEIGFGSAEKVVIETLVEMLQSLLSEIGRSGRAYCELAGRTEPLVGDIAVALIEMGINVTNISNFALRANRVTIPSPAQMPRQSTPKILQAGEKRPLSSYIPDYFPPFPDPHAYIRTPTYKQPVTEYEAIREKSASQKRDVERALTRFMAKTCEPSSTHNLFFDEQMRNMFPLIPLKITSNVYLQALIPKDQIFDSDVDEMEDQSISEGKEIEGKDDGVKSGENEMTSGNANEHEASKKHLSVGETGETTHGEVKSNRTLSQEVECDATDNDNDNPYLKNVKLCRKKHKK